MKTFHVVLRGLFLCFILALVPSCVNGDVTVAPYDIEAAIGVENIMPVIIIGSGPAGLSAALYTCRGNFKTLVIEGNEPGGQLTKTSYVENWPGIKRVLGKGAIGTVREQAKSFGAEFLPDHVIKVDLSSWPFAVYTQAGLKLHAMALIIATGAHPRYLHIKGEEEYWGSGVTACAICDAPLYKGEEVVVIGGGDAAVEEAIQLSSYAKKVTVLVRKGKMRATWTMQEHLKGYPNISVMHNVQVKEILGDGTFVTGVRLFNNLTNETTDFTTAGVFLAIGRIPNSQMFLSSLDVDAGGHINLAGRSQATSIPGVFAAGDVSDPTYRQAGVAAGNGIKAGLDSSRYLSLLGLNELFWPKVEPTIFRGGKTGDEVALLEKIKNLEELQEKVKKSDVPVILDFYTEHCPSCPQMMPKIASVAESFAGKVKVYKVDAEEAMDVTQELMVPKVPYLVIFKDGKVIDRTGYEMNREEIKALFERLSK